MGKDSLLESTSKKNAAAKADKEKPSKKKSAASGSANSKKSAKSKAGAKARKSAAAKDQKAAAAKTAARVETTAARPQNPASPASARKPTRKELLWKKFASYPVAARYTPAPAHKAEPAADAPSFFSGMSDADARKAREYMQRKFDWADIKAAGEKYAAELSAKTAAAAKQKAEEDAKRKAEEDARRKAEEDAKRKAEEDARRKAEEDAKRKAEEDAKRKAEEDAKRKAAAQMPPPPPAESGAGTAGGVNPIKIGIVAFCAIILLLVYSSYSNTRKYYLQEQDGAVEIWRGIFSPMGQTRLMILPGIQMPQEQKEVYTWQDAYRLMYQYHIERADAILEVPGVPDTAELTANLEKAIQYAPNRELGDAARSRLIGIRMQTLVHKAQAALNRGTSESAAAAIGFLEEAAQYNLSPAEAEMIQRKIEEAEAIRANREMAEAAAEQAAAAEAALAEEAQTLEEASEGPSPVVEEGGN